MGGEGSKGVQLGGGKTIKRFAAKGGQRGEWTFGSAMKDQDGNLACREGGKKIPKKNNENKPGDRGTKKQNIKKQGEGVNLQSRGKGGGRGC